MYWSSPFRSTLNTGYITALDMCEVCTKAVHSVALWTRVTLQLWTCVKYVLVQAVHAVALRTRVTLQLWTCVKYVLVQAVHAVALRTRFTLQLCDMCEVCTQAVHSVALWTRVIHSSFRRAWSMYRSSPFRSTLNTGYITALDMCVCTEAVHSVALWTRVTLQLWTCVTYVPKQSIP